MTEREVFDMVPVLDVHGREIYFVEQEVTPRTGVYGIIVDDQARVLLVTVPATGKYWLPGGGVDGSEPLGAALIRECAEECDLEDLVIDDKVGEIEHLFTPDYVRAWRQTSRVFICRSTQTHVRVRLHDPREGALNPTWVPIEQLTHAGLFQSPFGQIVPDALAACVSVS